MDGAMNRKPQAAKQSYLPACSEGLVPTAAFLLCKSSFRVESQPFSQPAVRSSALACRLWRGSFVRPHHNRTGKVPPY